uniref:Uncharacterized protein n=1 Tax=Dasysiphonia japonica TaxID=2506492 RepID=A0A4D6WTF7_9FLOR|nr:hypothetical protein [Dasysiphonia japonica]
MNNHYYLNHADGQWTTKNSLYLLKNKSEYKYEEKFEILKNIAKDINADLLLKNNYIKDNHDYFFYQVNDDIDIKKIKNDFKETYNIDIFDKDLIKIEKQINFKKLKYQEYIYSISDNVKVSFGLLKKQNKYLFILFKSYIKRINK